MKELKTTEKIDMISTNPYRAMDYFIDDDADKTKEALRAEFIKMLDETIVDADELMQIILDIREKMPSTDTEAKVRTTLILSLSKLARNFYF